MRIGYHMTPNPVTIDSRARLNEAVRLMERFGISHLPVVDDERRLTGVVTHRELLQAACQDMRFAECSVADVMLRRPVTLSSGASMTSAVSLVCEKHVDSLIVVDSQNRVEGIITRADLLLVMSRLLGLDREGSCVEVALLEHNDDLAIAFNALREVGAKVISAIGACVRDDGDEPALYLRVDDSTPKRVEEALARAGLILLEPENATSTIVSRKRPRHQLNGNSSMRLLARLLRTNFDDQPRHDPLQRLEIGSPRMTVSDPSAPAE
ncbi:MAG: CBS domain-containing protein [Phycisphaerae bacterium]|nr:CBS domain-containing protein [Phycisphaerae bacterium]